MTEDELVPGEFFPREEPVSINEDRETETVSVTNNGDRPIQVGSHFHFFEVNRKLEFDRKAAFGMRLDIPAGVSIRVEPGDTKEVRLVELGGNRRVSGLNNLTNSSVDGELNRKRALGRARRRGFEGA
jgi:urease beta subunit